MQNPKTKKGTELPLLNLKGKPYLQVPWRVLWFCEEKPDWSIETEIIYRDLDVSIVRATIKDPGGRIIRMATKQETKQGFADHLEKAETGAIGRALGLMGYGTQFALELEEGDRIVDSPLAAYKEEWGPDPDTVMKGPGVPFLAMDKNKPVNHAPQKNGLSEAQVKRYFAMARNLGWSNADALTHLKQKSGKEKVEMLSREEYTLITTKMQVEIDKLTKGK